MGFTVGMAFVFVSLLYSIGLNVLYFSKKHVKNYETRLFSVFLPTNLFGLFLELACGISVDLLGMESLVSIWLSKILLVYLLFFLLLLVLYIYVICGSDSTVIELSDKQRKNRNYGKRNFTNRW